MKRLFILALSLVLLAACGRLAQAPEEPTTEETTIVTATEAPTTEPIETKPIDPAAKPFTKDDIAAIEANFNTVGDYVRAVPAAWYEVICWNAVEDRVRIRFWDHEPIYEEEWCFFEIATGFVEAYSRAEDTIHKTIQSVPKDLLAETARIDYIDFAKTGSAITPPRGIMIGDNAQKIFDVYPDYRIGDGTILYDITAIYPWAKPEWGSTVEELPEESVILEGDIDIIGWERMLAYDFLGGRIWNKDSYYIARFIYMDKPFWWDEREGDSAWTGDVYSYRWRLDYTIEENTIQGIEFVLSYHPN